MAECGEKRMNLAALQRVDPYINKIVCMASQVALYKFNGSANEWEKTDVEGTLFVYSRCAKPNYGFTIMNRLNRNNLVEPLTADMEFQRQDPFLLYKNSKGIIYGIWCYDKDDCCKIDDVMNSMLDSICNNGDKTNANHAPNYYGCDPGVRQRPVEQQLHSVDIMSMLTMAQNEYNRGKGSGDDAPSADAGSGRSAAEPKTITDNAVHLTDVIRPKAVRAVTGANSSGPPPDLTSGTVSSRSPSDGTSLSVAALFASASGLQNSRCSDGNGNLLVEPRSAAPLMIENHKIGNRLQWQPGGESVTSLPVKNPQVEQSLHAVLQRLISNPEHSLEHIERQQRAAQNRPPDGKDDGRRKSESDHLCEQLYKQLQTHSAIQTPQIHVPFTPVLTPSMFLTERKVDPPSPSTDFGYAVPLPTTPKVLPTPPKTLAQTSNSAVGTVSLMSPMMFIGTKPPMATTPIAEPVAVLESKPVVPQVTPLTREQLGQSMIHLIQNDSEFLGKLHDAYVKSLTDYLANSQRNQGNRS